MKTLLRGVTVIGLLATTSLALAQPPGGGRGGRGGPPPEPSLITYELAEAAIDAAEAYARDNNWSVTILVTDQNANPVMMRRLDGAPPFTYTIATRKALTVTGSGLTSGEYGTKLEAGEIDEIENAVTFAGGVPVYRDGELIGAIATSGVTADQDEEVSTAGAEVIGSVSRE
jgi:uncharacterized protein GlcG (DUF336 family)